MTAHIVAMGGGGFGMSEMGAPTNLDRYLVELTGKQSPLVCFIPTAAADDPQYINKFLVAYGTLGVRPMVLTLWQDPANSIRRLAEADLVLIGNGNTVNMLALWKAHGVHKALMRRYEAGDVVIGGISAGGNAVFEGFVTDSFGYFKPHTGGLGLLDGSFCCHFDSEDGRVGVYTDAVANGQLPGGWACDDRAGVHYADGQVVGFVAEEPHKRVFRVMPSNSPTTSGVLAEPQQVEIL